MPLGLVLAAGTPVRFFFVVLILLAKLQKSIDIRNKSPDFILKKCQYIPLKNVKTYFALPTLFARHAAPLRAHHALPCC